MSIVGDWCPLASRRAGRRRAVFYRERDGVGCVVHGDDFTYEGPADALASIPDDLRTCWLLKIRGLLGPDSTDDKEVPILNRVVRWENGDILYEADPRHVEKLLRDLGMESCKPLTTPGAKPICPPPPHGAGLWNL